MQQYYNQTRYKPFISLSPTVPQFLGLSRTAITRAQCFLCIPINSARHLWTRPLLKLKKSWTIIDPNEISFYSQKGGFIWNNGNSKCTQDSFVLRDTGAMLAGNTKKIELRNCVTRLEQKRIQSSSLAWKY